MPDFNVRSDSVNVEQIMEQIRARIREKRGVDYTEQQIRELAAVKLEKFLDPSGVRSDLLDQFRKAQPAYQPPELPNFAFEDATLFESHRAPIRWMRKLLNPLLKLLFNPNPLIQALHIQARLNAMNAEREAKRESARRAMDQLYYELVHNLVVETTRTAIEVKNLKMRVESISSRLEFAERRARALEGAVVYRTADVEEAPSPRLAQQPQRQQSSFQRPPNQPQQRYTPPQAPASSAPVAASTPTAGAASSTDPQTISTQTPGQGVPGEGPGQRSRRRRRRRGRRGGGAAAIVMGTPGVSAPNAANESSEPGEAADSLDAMDPMDDDGASELEETQAAGVEQVGEAPAAETRHAEPVAEQTHAQPVEHETPRIAPADPVRIDATPAAPEASTAAAAPEAPAPVTPAAPDHADRDPQ
jgi:hypothetical protein